MNVAYINGICVRNDAISRAIVDSMEALASHGDKVRLYAYQCDVPDLPCRIVRNGGEIVSDPAFRQVDVVAFHFGIYNPLFNVIFALDRHMRSLVRFHNVTPKRFVSPAHHAIIDRSLAQVPNLRWADHIVCDSTTNQETLSSHSIGAPSSVIPLAVDVRAAPASKPGHVDGIVRIAFVGRFVRSKGCGDLLEAVRLAALEAPNISYQLDLIGNLAFAEIDVIGQVEQSRARLGPNVSLVLHGDASDDVKWLRLADADLFVLPTYHEGFCVTIVEALSAGCRVVSYDNSNVPVISGGLATLVPSGDVRRLAETIAAESRVVRSAEWRTEGYRRHKAVCERYAAGFSKTIFGNRLVSLVHRLFQRPRGLHRERP